jgi:hypothetical protein
MRFGEVPKRKFLTLADLDARRMTFENYSSRSIDVARQRAGLPTRNPEFDSRILHQTSVRPMSKHFEDVVIRRVKSIMAGEPHGFSDKGLAMLAVRYSEIRKRREQHDEL